MQFAVTRWNKSTPPVESELHELFFKEGLFPYDWSNSPGDTYAPHVHDYDKVIVVVHGSIKWTLGMRQTAETIETHAGDRIDLPRGTLHAAQVGPQGVTCLEGRIV
jgi:quercetin dioxygenase-like cupin family protein